MNMLDRSGQQIGSYRLVRRLGQGGFAEVYLGEHIHLKTSVAIKLLIRQMTPQDVSDFMHEARTAAALIHPHIARILDFGFDNSFPFLVMDYASNGTLRQLYPRGSSLPLQELLPYIKQVASALQYAHEHKVVHRDVKPENILLGANKEVLLGDFGIAIPAHQTHSMSLQNVFGSVHYMAPEHTQGKARAASDQYSLGVIVYELLYGQPPFTGSTPIEIAMKHQSQMPESLQAKVPSLSPRVEEVVLKALAKDPHQRFTSVQDFVDALEQAAQTKSSTRLFLSQTAIDSNIVFSPDGHHIAFACNNTLHVQNVDTGSTLYTWYLPSVETYSGVKEDKVFTVSWSPDGSQIAAGTKFGIRFWDAATGEAISWNEQGAIGERKQEVLSNHWSPYHHDEMRAIAWSPDGKQIAGWLADYATFSSAGFKTYGPGPHVIHIWDITTRRTANVFRYRSEATCLAWSPDGKYLLATPSDPRNSLSSDLPVIWEVMTGKRTMTYGKDRYVFVHTGAWSPDSKYIALGSFSSFKNDDEMVHVWETNPWSPLLSYHGHRGSVLAIAWSPDSTRIASAGEDKSIQIWSATTGRTLLKYYGHSGSVGTIAWSPDGTRIASVSGKTIHVWWVGNKKKDK